MKSLLFGAILVIPFTLSAQDFIAPQGSRRQIQVEAPQLEPSIEGIVKDIFDHRKPWQVLNPLAPAKYGTGEKNVSKDSGGGTPHEAKTLTIIGVEW